MYCKLYKCTMTIQSCWENQIIAEEAAEILIDNPYNLGDLSGQKLDRLMTCGVCKGSGLEGEKMRKAYKCIQEVIELYLEICMGYGKEAE